MAQSRNDVSNCKSVESDEHSGASSELTESEPGDVEVQSPTSNMRGSLSAKSLRTSPNILYTCTKVDTGFRGLQIES